MYAPCSYFSTCSTKASPSSYTGPCTKIDDGFIMFPAFHPHCCLRDIVRCLCRSVSVYYYDARSAIHRCVLTPALRHTFDAETGHKIAVKVLRSGLGPRDPVRDDDRLQSEVDNYPLKGWLRLLIVFRVSSGGRSYRTLLA